jgi:DNA-binding transcriptional regulator GbsR (MarR family)
MQKMTPVRRKFILHWGEMGSRWGINRTVAQIHALLYMAEKPLDAEAISELLGVARSNVSTSLRELQGWGIVKIVHLAGDRRDHFESMGDVWEMFRTVLEQRKRREIDPTLDILKECLAEAEQSGADPVERQRLKALHEFFETSVGWYEELSRLPTAALVQFLKLGSKMRKALGLGGK